MEFEFALSEFMRYLNDLQAISSGVPFSALGYSERREAQRVSFIPAEGALVDRYDVMGWGDPIQPGSIAHLKLTGVMRSQSMISSPGVDMMISDLRRAYNHPNVEAVVIETNSGGGESMAGTMLKSAIMERNKPVIGFAHMAASAAYRALSGADEIIASSDAAEFGSIGTMISIDQKFLNKYRSRIADFYGSGAPDKNGEFRAAIGGDFSRLQSRVDELTARFQEEIKRDRPLRGDKKSTLSGAMFDALASKERGLIDGVGTMRYVMDRMKKIKKAKYS